MRRALLLLLAFAACSDAPGTTQPTARSGPPVVVAVNYPLAYFAKRLGGDAIDVRFLAPADVDPAFWTPDAAAVSEMQAADLILMNGAGYATWLSYVSLPDRTVDTSRALFPDRLLMEQDAVTHAHGPTGEHAHGDAAFTTWLDPRQALEQAAAIHLALESVAVDSDDTPLQSDLKALDDRLEAAFAPLRGKPVLASHPVYQYLARRYELDVASLHWEPDATPDAAAWLEFDKLRAAHVAKWMLWEDEPTAATRAALEQRGIAVIVFRPCGNRPTTGDYLTEMNANATRVLDGTGGN